MKMANRIYLKCILLMVELHSCVMGREFIGNPYIEHWLRALAPPADCSGASPGDKAVDTSDCKKFFLCTGDGSMLPDPFACPEEDGFLCFDSATGECSDVEAACDVACALTAPSCTSECTVLGDNTADLTNCNRHYLCLGDSTAGKIELYCPDERPHFNGKECVNDKSQCCNCHVGTCENTGELLADPQNCHAFYACADLDGTGDIDALGPVTCPNGGSFVSGECDATTTDCENICDLGDIVTSTSPTDSSDPTSTQLISTFHTLTSTSSSASSTAETTVTTPTSTAESTTITTPHTTGSMSTAETTTITTPTMTGSTSTAETTTITKPTTTQLCTDLSEFWCYSYGHYARCPYCDPSYFSCNSASWTPIIRYCPRDLVFNPNPLYPYCIRPEHCPYNP
ncbi:unnamed protein product [Meganyctiphanes norvegica]|uniref:Chitin-binding type-2 domain-containing protein n=1 Tax=Meganyctiphanes norvegica TaxID=48144 RepID=A0AAV2S262_MEGNR